jgi:hypothetical protein
MLAGILRDEADFEGALWAEPVEFEARTQLTGRGRRAPTARDRAERALVRLPLRPDTCFLRERP